jgi:hypothetical protein
VPELEFSRQPLLGAAKVIIIAHHERGVWRMSRTINNNAYNI